MGNGVILYVKNQDRLDKIIDRLSECDNDSDFQKGESKEIFYLTKELNNSGFNTYISNFERVNEQTLYHNAVYDSVKNTYIDFDVDSLNIFVTAIIPRMLGSIEKQVNRVEIFFRNLKNDFSGIVINNPDTVIYGLRKYYLKDFFPYHINIPKTSIYDVDIKYDYLINQYDKNSHIIKPLTGELGNSVEFLKDINQDYLDHKKGKVGGWIIQPFYKTIWDGERQYVFVNNELIYGYLKDYKKDDSSCDKLPRLSNIEFQKDYNINHADIELCKNVLNILNTKLNYITHICRFDIINDLQQNPMLLECELVNPSFRSWYIPELAKKITEMIKEKTVNL